jgi:hypothetical protein
LHRLKVKESEIPLSILYNTQINKLKAAEHDLKIKENAILMKVEDKNIAKDGMIEVTY